jgi:hypothetical protein
MVVVPPPCFQCAICLKVKHCGGCNNCNLCTLKRWFFFSFFVCLFGFDFVWLFSCLQGLFVFFFRFWVLDKSRIVEFLLWFVCAWSSTANYILIWNKRESFWLALLKPIFVNKNIIWALAYLHQHIFFALCIILKKLSNEFVNDCNWFHCVHGDGLLKLNNCQNWKILNYLVFSTLIH